MVTPLLSVEASIAKPEGSFTARSLLRVRVWPLSAGAKVMALNVVVDAAAVAMAQRRVPLPESARLETRMGAAASMLNASRRSVLLADVVLAISNWAVVPVARKTSLMVW
jgi:hypothetical protein